MEGAGRNTQNDEEKNHGTWGKYILQGVGILLGLAKEASQYAPVPGLQTAANVALQIFQSVQGVKENEAAFQSLASDAIGIVDVVWRSYQISSNQKDWPSKEQKEGIQELVVNLCEINDFVDTQLQRSKSSRFLKSTEDLATIAKYREVLQSSVSKFGISSLLAITNGQNDLKIIGHQILKNQEKILERLEKRGITVNVTDAEEITMKSSQEDDSKKVHVNCVGIHGAFIDLPSMYPTYTRCFSDAPRAMVPAYDTSSVTIAVSQWLAAATGESLQSSSDNQIRSLRVAGERMPQAHSPYLLTGYHTALDLSSGSRNFLSPSSQVRSRTPPPSLSFDKLLMHVPYYDPTSQANAPIIIQNVNNYYMHPSPAPHVRYRPSLFKRIRRFFGL